MSFLHYTIIGAPKKLKHQPRPLVRSSSLKFGKNFWNLSHETVSLMLSPFWFYISHICPFYFIFNYLSLLPPYSSSWLHVHTLDFIIHPLWVLEQKPRKAETSFWKLANKWRVGEKKGKSSIGNNVIFLAFYLLF